MNHRFLCAAAAIAVVGVSIRMSAQEGFQPRQIGRYQMSPGLGGAIYIMDTSTGKFWRGGDRPWELHEGPLHTPPNADEKKAAALDLKGKPVEMVIIQREERAVPGSDGTVLIRVGDITDGQAFLTIVDDDRKELLSRTSVRTGDVVEFQIGGKHFAVKVNELRNILIGDDFAKLTVIEGKKLGGNDAIREIEAKK